MKTLIIAFILLLLTNTAFTDELQIGFSCYPKKVQAVFKEHGLKLDLSANDREEDSWGFIVSKGSTFSIFTYRQLSKEQMGYVMQILGEIYE